MALAISSLALSYSACASATFLASTASSASASFSSFWAISDRPLYSCAASPTDFPPRLARILFANKLVRGFGGGGTYSPGSINRCFSAAFASFSFFLALALRGFLALGAISGERNGGKAGRELAKRERVQH